MHPLLRIWRWRRIRWAGVVMASRHHPYPDAIAYTWRGARVGTATRDQLAAALTRAERRRARRVAAQIRAANPDWIAALEQRGRP
jgi:hypothetical protein